MTEPYTFSDHGDVIFAQLFTVIFIHFDMWIPAAIPTSKW